MTVAVGIMLSVCAIEDWVARKISILWPAICMVAGIILRVVNNSLQTADFWFGLLIGLIMVAISAISGGQIGSGDALVITACGICLGWASLIVLLFCSMLLFLIVGVGGIFMKKWTGKKALAFVPFIWGAFMVNCLIGGI